MAQTPLKIHKYKHNNYLVGIIQLRILIQILKAPQMIIQLILPL